MSRSTWACELKSCICKMRGNGGVSRSTWACELKLYVASTFFPSYGHAPRERVSWNNWVWIVIHRVNASRSTWACELKWFCRLHISKNLCHAPRERVSWNPTFWQIVGNTGPVTLHVSVWVEISSLAPAVWVFQSRSTWACELKLL